MLRGAGTRVVIANDEVAEPLVALIAGPAAKIVRVSTRALDEFARAVTAGSPSSSFAHAAIIVASTLYTMRRNALKGAPK